MVVGLLLAALLPSARAAGPSTVVLSDSTREVAPAPPAGTASPRWPFISRVTLTPAESGAPMMFEVALKMRNFADLQARVSRGEQISAAEMAAKYEPLPADYQAVADWLAGEGLTIMRRDSHHMAIFARDKVSRIAQALRVNFARVKSQGVEYTSAVTAPSVPANIAPRLIGINGLQPHLRAHRHLSKPRPDASGALGTYLPSQIAQAYGASGLYGANISGGGQTIAIVIDTFPSTTDLLLFWKKCNVNQSISNLQFIQAVPGPLDATSGEETLDVEWSSAMAPGAHIRVYASADFAPADIDAAYQQVLDDVSGSPPLEIHQMSMSFGLGEVDTTNAQMQTDDNYFVQLAAKGVTIFAASGDNGPTPDIGQTGSEMYSIQADFPASDPNVTGVGGTTLMLDANNNITSETVWNSNGGASGGGTSVYFHRPTWQTGTGVGSGTMREVPDVAASADPDYSAVTYFAGAQSGVGGTSWASPTWAGFCALMNQARANAGQNPLGVLGPHIYPLLGTAGYATDIRDIVSGNNDTNGSNGFTAQVGYDRATGIGSPKVEALAETLVGSTTLAGVQMPAAMQSVIPGQNATFTVAVGGSSAAYQWQRMPVGGTTWSNLNDNGTYSGSASATLTITNSGPPMSGDRFQCLITLSGTVVTSTPSVLIVELPLAVAALAGEAGFPGRQNGSGTNATFNYPSGIALDSSGNLYVADYGNNEIREVTPAGVVSTPYGSLTGASGSTNAGGNNALFNSPNGIACDSAGNLYVADLANYLIRKISSGVVSTLAGSGGELYDPEGVAVDSQGNVYVADTFNDAIRKITAGGILTTVAGKPGINGLPGSPADVNNERGGTPGYLDGAVAQALFNLPSAVAVDSAGNVYVADSGNCVIRKIDIGSGMVSTVAGQPAISGYLDGPVASALFNSPIGVTVDSANNLYIADALVPGYIPNPNNPGGPTILSNAAGNGLVRKVTPAGVVSTLAGQAGNEGGANGTGTAAEFSSLQALARNPAGILYLADTFDHTIRVGTPLTLPTISVSATQPQASVFGLTPGQFTVTRTGNTSASLTVNYTTAGSALGGTDYAPLLDTATIPAGATSVVIPVTPISNPQATNPTVQLTLGSAFAYTLGSPNAATVTIAELTSYQNWKLSNFGPNAATDGRASDTADPNGNGVPNLLEYAFNSDPNLPGTEPLPVESVVPDGNGVDHLAITYTRRNTDPNLIYMVQVTGDLAQHTDQWHSGAPYTAVISQVQSQNGDTTQVTVQDNTPFSPSTNRFIRVQVTQNAP